MLLIFGGLAVAALAVYVLFQGQAENASAVVVSTAEPDASPTWMNTGAGWTQDSSGHYVQERPSSSSGITTTDLLTGGATRLPGASYLNPLSW